VREIREIFGTEVGHRVVSEISPDALDWIEFGGIRGHIVQSDGAVTLLAFTGYNPARMHNPLASDLRSPGATLSGQVIETSTQPSS
jgi:hypothetical protein